MRFNFEQIPKVAKYYSMNKDIKTSSNLLLAPSLITKG
jgi:hypothetical protein